MILHATTLAVLFVQQVSQTPIVVQCVQSPAADLGWKQWIPTAVSLVSIGVGVWIAQWSFSATSERDHKRWILDQKKAEWKDLLAKAAEIEHVIPVASDQGAAYEAIANRLGPLTRELLEVKARSFFISICQACQTEEDGLTIFHLKAIAASEEIQRNVRLLDGSQGLEERSIYLNNLRAVFEKIMGERLAFADWLRSEAQKDTRIARFKVP